MGVPFLDFPDLLDSFPILKQFRAIGRFTWPFYFVFTVFTAYHFQVIILKFWSSNKRIIGTVILLICFLFPLLESYSFHKYVANRVTEKVNLFKLDLLDSTRKQAIQTISKSNYQATLSLPFFHHGSESFERPPNNENALQNIYTISYHTGIPTFSANLTRTSISESKKIIQLVTPNYYPKPIAKEVRKDWPFLIVLSDSSLTKYEQNMNKIYWTKPK